MNLVNKYRPSYKKTLILLFLAMAFFCALFIIYSRKSIYHYNTNADYAYDFTNSTAIKTELTLKDGILTLPESQALNETAFIKIEVNTSFLGNYFQPIITISSDDTTSTQYIEHGAKGIRYLNISDFINRENRELTFTTDKINLKDQTVVLYEFQNLSFENATILVLAPHPDDAEIAAFGLYAKNKHSFVITITSGDAGPDTYDEIFKQDTVKQYLEKGKLRTLNSITVPLLGGIPYENSLNLGFFDSTLRRMHENDTLVVPSVFTKTSDINTYRKLNVSKLKNGLTGVSNWKSLVQNLKFLLDTIKPDVIVSPYPLIDYHPDHKYTTIALIEALKALNIRKGNLLLYTNHHTVCEYYPFGETGNAVTLPPYFKDGFYFSSLYSNSLSNSLQQDKLFALEAQNDLRLDTEWRFSTKLIKTTTVDIVKNILGRKKDYFKRAVRSNELFFVVPIDKLYSEDVYKKITKAY